MSNINQSNEFLKKFYENQISVVSTQIRNNYQNTTSSIAPDSPNNSENIENQKFSKLNSSIEKLTIDMKDFLKHGENSFNQSDGDNTERQLSRAEKSVISHNLRSTLVETSAENLLIIPHNNKDPLHSVTMFTDLQLKPELLNGICSMNFRNPSAIQGRALPMLLDSKPNNIIAQSQSGTGKTATFLLAMLSKVNVNERFCQCLCMAPTRELAIQIADVAASMSKFMNKIKIACAVRESQPDIFEGEVDSQIIIGTPGTLKQWTSENDYKYINVKRLKVFVLDEADVLIENAEFLHIAKRIKSKVTNNCQILLFSATYDERVMDFAHEFVPNPTEFRVKPQELTLRNIKQFYIKMDSVEEKYPTLIEIYGKKSMGQCIIFCETRKMALYLQKSLENDSHLSSLLTGELDVMKRQQQIIDFRNGKSRVLIATNLCSRGIDIPQVNLIINWDMPRTKDNQPDCETYLHRIGRSGRFGKTGLTINFIVSDCDLMIQEKITDIYGVKIEEMTDLDIVSKI